MLKLDVLSKTSMNEGMQHTIPDYHIFIATSCHFLQDPWDIDLESSDTIHFHYLVSATITVVSCTNHYRHCSAGCPISRAQHLQILTLRPKNRTSHYNALPTIAGCPLLVSTVFYRLHFFSPININFPTTSLRSPPNKLLLRLS